MWSHPTPPYHLFDFSEKNFINRDVKRDFENLANNHKALFAWNDNAINIFVNNGTTSGSGICSRGSLRSSAIFHGIPLGAGLHELVRICHSNICDAGRLEADHCRQWGWISLRRPLLVLRRGLVSLLGRPSC